MSGGTDPRHDRRGTFILSVNEPTASAQWNGVPGFSIRDRGVLPWRYAQNDMNLLTILGLTGGRQEANPDFVREVEDIRGVRLIRLQGTVGRDIGAQASAADAWAAMRPGVFERPVLFDFAGTTGWDFSTVSYLVLALKRRMAAHARVGIINAPPKLVAELDIGHVKGLFRIYASEEQAIADLTGSASAGATAVDATRPPAP
jgi:hypothetical protein